MLDYMVISLRLLKFAAHRLPSTSMGTKTRFLIALYKQLHPLSEVVQARIDAEGITVYAKNETRVMRATIRGDAIEII